MKKFGAIVLIVLVSVLLTACSTFHDDSLETTPLDEPYQATVFLKSENPTATLSTLLTEWEAEINRMITEMAMDNGDTPKITAVKVNNIAENNICTVQLTLSNVPPLNIKKSVRPFKIYYTQTIYNPIELLPNSDHFDYIVGLATTRRHSAVNTDWVNAQEDGSYLYLWNTRHPIEFQDVYPNRLLYYVLVVAGAMVIGVIVYLVSRYSDCKKREKTL